MSNLPAHLSFADTELTIIDQQGHPWISAADLARALGYADDRAVSRIYNRNTDEFCSEMSGVVNLTTPGNPMPIPVRIFSPRGCHLIAMLARTPRAKAFRKWVLDVLEGLERAETNANPLPRDILHHRRYLLSFDRDGRSHMREISDRAIVLEPNNSAALFTLIYEHVPIAQLPNIVRTAMERIEARHGPTWALLDK